MNKSIIIIGVIVIVLLVGGWWIWSQNAVAPVSQTETVNNQQQQNTTPVVKNTTPTPTTPKTYEIIYTDAGYSPAMLTIKMGDTVTFKNNSNMGMWPASAMHPTHTGYSGTSLQAHCPDVENDDFDACGSIAAGQTWSFTFMKVGQWSFHDHMNSSKFGQIVVE